MTGPISHFDQLLSRVRNLIHEKGKPRAAILGCNEKYVLEAIARANNDGMIDAELLGVSTDIKDKAQNANLNIDNLNVIEAGSLEQAIGICIDKVNKREIDFILIGNLEKLANRVELLNGLSRLLPGSKSISHVALFELPDYPRFLLMSDGFINVAPDIKRKFDIIKNAVKISNILGSVMPKVALLAAVEVVYPGMRVTEESAAISKMAADGQIKDCLIDGPLSFDVATVPKVARQKGSLSEISGQADILIAPNVETGNGIYKAMSIFVKAKGAGAIMGGDIPVTVSSYCDGSENIFYSLALGAYMALHNSGY